MKTDVYNFKREKTGTVDLPDALFARTWNESVVKQSLDAQLANRRAPWSHVKTRADVRGGGRKPWRQKGTGRARHGSIRSPLWVGGGKAHGPSNERDYSQKVNKKMRRAAIAMVLSRKLKEGELTVLEGIRLEAPKTKALAAKLREFMALPKAKKNYDVLLVPNREEKAVARAGANLPKTKVSHAGSLNLYDMLNHRYLMIDRAAVAELAARYGKEE